MALSTWFRKVWGKERLEPAEHTYVLKTDTQNTGIILARARDSVQIEKVTTAIQQIEQIWTEEEQRNFVKLILMIDATYPHLEKMADLEPLSADWHAEWAKAMEIANEGADQLLKRQEEFSQILDEIENSRNPPLRNSK